MKVKTQGHTTIIKDTKGDISSFLDNVTQQYHSYKNTNLILDISHAKDAENKDVLSFLNLSNQHRKNKKSFVLVMHEDFDFNSATTKIMVVPTLQEAHDIIEMDEIERDLGF